MIRGSLASLIYRNSMVTNTGDDELAAVTLMSEDIDNIIGNLEPVFDIPASIVEVIVGLWLLWRRLGPVSFAPILLLGTCTYVQKLVGNALNERRAIWTKAIQKRVGLTTNLLRSMKSVKMSGLVHASARLVQAERVRELQLGKSFRWFVVWMNAFGKTMLL
jgi:ATP-binding cassette subfamily C (CFTR/MRP) protein 1